MLLNVWVFIILIILFLQSSREMREERKWFYPYKIIQDIQIEKKGALEPNFSEYLMLYAVYDLLYAESRTPLDYIYSYVISIFAKGI